MVVSLRPSRAVSFQVGHFAFPGIFIVVAALIPPLRGKATPAVMLGFAAFFLLPALFYAFYKLRARLVADETGLRWRTWGGWKSAAWAGVRDFYDLPPKSGEKKAWDKTGDLMTIETVVGAITLNRRWPECDALRQIIQERAQQAKAKSWGVRGLRQDADDRRVFAYNRRDFWKTLLIGGGILLPYSGYGLWWILHPKGRSFGTMLTEGWTPGDFWFSLFATAFIVFLVFGFIILVGFPALLYLSAIPALLETRRRWNERITTSREGIAFDDGRRHVSAKWEQVTGYFIGPSSESKSRLLGFIAWSSSRLEKWRWVFVVETEAGRFEYAPIIENSEELGQIIKERAMPLRGRDSEA